jgi:SAM-dependent methyltransferase
VRVRDGVLRSYIAHAPLALALERSVEAELYRHLPLNSPVLDLGCGEGLFAKLVFSDPLDTGIDPDPGEISRAQALKAHRELLVADGRRIPKPAGHFETVISNSVLEHIPDLLPVLTEVYRVTAPGGRFYLTVPSDRFDRYSLLSRMLEAVGAESAAQRYRRFYNRFWRHFHFYPVSEWAALLEAVGFRITEAYSYNPPILCLLNDLLVPLALPALVAKKWTGRWIIAPAWRNWIAGPLYTLLAPVAAHGGKCPDGGLVFVAAEK